MAAVALSETSKTELAHKLERAKATLKSMRSHGQRVAKLGTDALLTAAGGAAAGALMVKMPKLPGTQVDSDLAIGTICCLLAFADVADGMNAELNALGGGMVAVAVAREVQKMLIKQ